MTGLARQGRRNLMELLDAAWPFDTVANLDIAAPGAMSMRMEEFVQDDTLVVRAELPGVDPKHVDITIANHLLTITAERKDESTTGEQGKAGYRSEFRYGSYSRSLSLPSGVTADDVKAHYADGILEVRVPLKRATEGPRKIEITRG